MNGHFLEYGLNPRAPGELQGHCLNCDAWFGAYLASDDLAAIVAAKMRIAQIFAPWRCPYDTVYARETGT